MIFQSWMVGFEGMRGGEFLQKSRQQMATIKFPSLLLAVGVLQRLVVAVEPSENDKSAFM